LVLPEKATLTVKPSDPNTAEDRAMLFCALTFAAAKKGRLKVHCNVTKITNKLTILFLNMGILFQSTINNSTRFQIEKLSTELKRKQTDSGELCAERKRVRDTKERKTVFREDLRANSEQL
jgi:hypothetical protein